MSEHNKAGGVARAAALSPERRSEIARMGALAKNPDPAERDRRKARNKAERAFARMRGAMEDYALAMGAAGASAEELSAAGDKVAALFRTAGKASPIEPGSAR